LVCLKIDIDYEKEVQNNGSVAVIMKRWYVFTYQ